MYITRPFDPDSFVFAGSYFSWIVHTRGCDVRIVNSACNDQLSKMLKKMRLHLKKIVKILRLNKYKLLFVLLFIMALFAVLVPWKLKMDVWSFFMIKKLAKKISFRYM